MAAPQGSDDVLSRSESEYDFIGKVVPYEIAAAKDLEGMQNILMVYWPDTYGASIRLEVAPA